MPAIPEVGFRDLPHPRFRLPVLAHPQRGRVFGDAIAAEERFHQPFSHHQKSVGRGGDPFDDFTPASAEESGIGVDARIDQHAITE